MKFVDEFAHTYVLDLDPDWPEPREQTAFFSQTNLTGTSRSSFQDIRVYPQKGESWIARFESNIAGAFSIALSTPDPDHACIIANGSGYWVDTATKTAQGLRLNLPITNAVASRKHALIVVTTWTDIVAYRSAEPVFHLQRIADDSLQISTLEEDILTVAGFIRGADDTQLKIGLVSGKLLHAKSLPSL
jgi:hypothetical protein